MPEPNHIAPELLEPIAFVGDALSPLFLEDPQKGRAGESLAAFRGLDVDAAAEAWPFVDPESARTALGQMVGGLSEGVTHDLVWEYRRLFVGPGHKAAAPWGSVYTDHEGVIFGESTLALRAWMRANGVKRLSGNGDPDDHIGLMLALMAWFAGNRPELLCEYLSLHLLTWAPHYLSLLEEVARHPFYQGLATLARSSLQGIQAQLSLTVNEPRFYR